jgi:hypothetical protein
MKRDAVAPGWRPRIRRHDLDEFVRLYHLRVLAKFLNGDLPPEQALIANEFRPLVRQVVTACAGRLPMSPIPKAASAPFNRLADGAPFRFSLQPAGAYEQLVALQRGEHRLALWPGTDCGLMIACPDARAHVVKLLVDYFGHASPERLKGCPLCGRWFVDQTRNNVRLRCSLACTWRWWNRDRRRRAGHAASRRLTRNQRTSRPQKRRGGTSVRR